MKTFKVTENFIKEAHTAACGKWKDRLEKEFPEVFETPYDEFKTYIFESKGDYYKLQRVEIGQFAWIGLAGTMYYANGTYKTAREALNAGSLRDDTIFVAESTQKFFQGIYDEFKK